MSTLMITDSENILRSVDIVYQVMVKASKVHNGLFPSAAERQNGNLLMDFPMPAPIPGQRNSDRAPRGCNLTHDIPLLASLDGLAKALNRERYTILRENYLNTWAKLCPTASPTGLLPWGEHSFWNLQHDTIGNSYLLQYGEQPLDAPAPTHHQMGTMPLADWRIIHAANPEALPRFVDGLEWHWMDDEHTLFNRHALITQMIRGHQIKRHAKMTGTDHKKASGSDFPGAAGVFVHDYAVALTLVDEPKAVWRDAMMEFCDSWWNRRLDNGLCAKSGGKSKMGWNGASIGQTMSLAEALIESGEVLKERDTELGETLFSRGAAFMEAILKCPQAELDEGRYCTTYNDDGTPFKVTQSWAGNRGHGITAGILLKILVNSQKAGLDEGLELVSRCARVYLNDRIPRNVIVRAGDPGLVIGLMGELYRQTNKQEWLDAAMLHATDAMELYFDSPLPRVATGRNHYENQQGSSKLVHALARLILLDKGIECQGGLLHPAY